MVNKPWDNLPDVNPQYLQQADQYHGMKGQSKPWDNLPDANVSNNNSKQSLKDKTYPTANPDYRANIQFGSVPLNQKDNRSFLQKASSAAGKFNDVVESSFQPFAFGALQGIANTGASIINAPLEAANALTGSNMRVNAPDFKKYMRTDNPYANAFFSGGELTGDLIGGGGTYGALGKAMRIGPTSTLTKKLLQGSGAGYLSGGSEPDLPYENLPSNRLIAAGLGGALAPASQLTNTALADKAYGLMNNAKNQSTKEFKDIFSEIPDNYGVLPKGSFDFKAIKRAFSGQKSDAIDNYLENPNVENAHFAQSALSKEIRELENQKESAKKIGNNFNKQGQLNKLIDSRNSLNEGLKDSLSDFSPQHLQRYINAKSNYEKNVVPYLGKGLEKYGSQEEWAKEIIKNLTSNRAFMEGQYKSNGRFIPAKAPEIGGLRTRALINRYTYPISQFLPKSKGR